MDNALHRTRDKYRRYPFHHIQNTMTILETKGYSSYAEYWQHLKKEREKSTRRDKTPQSPAVTGVSPNHGNILPVTNLA